MSTFTAFFVPGHGRGRTLGFPTLNLSVGDDCPDQGVYAVRVGFSEQLAKGVMHVGPRPTFGETDISIEVHLLEFEGHFPDLGVLITVEVLGRLREVMSFDSPEALKNRIAQDIMEAQSFF